MDAAVIEQIRDKFKSLRDVMDERGRRQWAAAGMSVRVSVTDTTRTERPDWCRLSDAELDEQIEHLVR